MPIDFYLLEMSPPCRAVWMTLKAVGVDFNPKAVNLFAGEHLKPEYLKINPTHTVPTLVDNGFVLWESRPILTYLVDKYGKNDSLYPKDLQKRFLVDRMLYFDGLTLYKGISEWLYPQLFQNKDADAEKEKNLNKNLGTLDEFLSKTKYAAGDHVTVADISLLASLTFLEVKDYDFSSHKHVDAWMKHLKSELPYFAECQKGLYDYKASLKK